MNHPAAPVSAALAVLVAALVLLQPSAQARGSHEASTRQAPGDPCRDFPSIQSSGRVDVEVQYAITASSAFSRLDATINWSVGIASERDEQSVSLQPGQSHVFKHTYRSQGPNSVALSASGPLAAGGGCNVFQQNLGQIFIGPRADPSSPPPPPAAPPGNPQAGGQPQANGPDLPSSFVGCTLFVSPIVRSSAAGSLTARPSQGAQQQQCLSDAQQRRYADLSARWNFVAAATSTFGAAVGVAAAATAAVAGTAVSPVIVAASGAVVVLGSLEWAVSGLYGLWATPRPTPAEISCAMVPSVVAGCRAARSPRHSSPLIRMPTSRRSRIQSFAGRRESRSRLASSVQRRRR